MKPSLRIPVVEIVGMIVIGAGLFLLVLLFVYASRAEQTPVGVATAALSLIPAPTKTPPPPPATETPIHPTPIPPGIIGIEVYVQVIGTGGDGLRLREGPGLDQEQRFLGLEAEIFQVIDGPIQADEYTWWHLESPHAEDRHGWAVSEYLDIVDEP